MSNLNHPRVVSLVGVCLKPLCMVLKLAPQGSLKDHLALCPQGMDSGVTHRLLFQVQCVVVDKLVCTAGLALRLIVMLL